MQEQHILHAHSSPYLLSAEVLNSSPRPPRSAYFACLSLLTHLIQVISSLEVHSVHEVCSDWHAPYTVSIAPYTVTIAPTQCPLLPTQCPLLPIQCPLLPTQCPLLPTQCPLLPIQCPLLPTPWAGKSIEVYFTSEHSFMDLRCAMS